MKTLKRDLEKCLHCGFCIAVCQKQAIYIKRLEMKVDFNLNKCILCGLCIKTCVCKIISITQSKG